MTDPVILDFKGLGHPSELCGFYHGAGGVISAVVSDELSFVDAMVNNTINCILFAEDVVMRAETYRIGGEFWTRYGDGDCIRRKAPLCPFQGIGSKVLAPTPEHVRRQLTMPKLHPSYADIFTLMHSHAESQLLLIAAGMDMIYAADFSLSTILGSWTYNSNSFHWLGNALTLVHSEGNPLGGNTLIGLHDTNMYAKCGQDYEYLLGLMRAALTNPTGPQQGASVLSKFTETLASTLGNEYLIHFTENATLPYDPRVMQETTWSTLVDMRKASVGSFDSQVICCEKECLDDRACNACANLLNLRTDHRCATGDTEDRAHGHVQVDSAEACMTEEGTFVYGEREYRLHTNEALTYDEAEVSCAAQSGQIASFETHEDYYAVMLGVSTSDDGMGIASAVLDHETYRDTINHIGDGDSSLGEVRLAKGRLWAGGRRRTDNEGNEWWGAADSTPQTPSFHQWWTSGNLANPILLPQDAPRPSSGDCASFEVVYMFTLAANCSFRLPFLCMNKLVADASASPKSVAPLDGGSPVALLDGGSPASSVDKMVWIGTALSLFILFQVAVFFVRWRKRKLDESKKHKPNSPENRPSNAEQIAMNLSAVLVTMDHMLDQLDQSVHIANVADFDRLAQIGMLEDKDKSQHTLPKMAAPSASSRMQTLSCILTSGPCSTSGEARNAQGFATYACLACLGEGATASCFLVEESVTRKHFVAKVPKVRKSKLAVAEAYNMALIEHTNVIGHHETFIHDGQLVVVMEYCELGDLGSLIAKMRAREEFFPEEFVTAVLLDMVHGVAMLHQNRICHRDLKPPNVFISKDGIFKVGDLGSSRLLIDTSSSFVGTPLYMAPEVLMQQPYSTESDIWSLGGLLYQLLTNDVPFHATTVHALQMKVLVEPKPIPRDRCRPELRELVISMLAVDPALRPSALDILETEWLVKCDRTELHATVQDTLTKLLSTDKSASDLTSVVVDTTDNEGGKAVLMTD